MDDRFRAILECLPKKRRRSRLEPWTELIVQLRRRGYTYREMTRILEEYGDLNVASTTVARIVAVHCFNLVRYYAAPSSGLRRQIIPAKPAEDSAYKRHCNHS
jgi:hypothetical protein